jgi:Fic family protein
MPAAYSWHPIEDLEADPKSLTDGEMESLWRIWTKQKSELTELQTLDEFNKRLGREWSIETGVIEKAYTLDRGVTRTLIERGIDATLIPHGASDLDSVLVARLIQDHYDTLEGMLDFVGGQRQLSTSYVKELHAALLRNVETYKVVDQLGRVFDKKLEKGKYKIAPNSPTRPDGTIHEYCPPEHVDSEMDRLILMYREHQTRSIPVEVEAAWLHHRFTQIHPFEDGNGRVARALATLVFIKAGWFPLIVKRDDWSRYIDVSEAADRRDLRPLVTMFVEAQRTALIQATDVAYEAKPIASAAEAIAAVRDRLLQRGKLPLTEWLEAKKTADTLLQITLNRLNEIAGGLTRQIAGLAKGFSFAVGGGPQLGFDKIRQAIVSQAVPMPDFAEYNALVNLGLSTGTVASLSISFQSVGPRYRGIISVVGYLTVQTSPPNILSTGTFLINYEESASDAQERYNPWLERVIVAGLTEWRRTL